VENPSKVEGKNHGFQGTREKPQAPASRTSLYRVRLQTPGIYNDLFFYPERWLTRGIYIETLIDLRDYTCVDDPERASASLRPKSAFIRV
jgi:hypothetical protein